MTDQFSPAGLQLLTTDEGYRSSAYLDRRGRGGVWTIGFGHTGPEVVAGLTWTRSQAEQQLAVDVARFCRGVVPLVPPTLGDNRFSALVCLAFNIGLGAFAGSSARHLACTGALDQVPDHIKLWNKDEADGHLVLVPGLVKRRRMEVALWNTPDGAPAPDFAAILNTPL